MDALRRALVAGERSATDLDLRSLFPEAAAATALEEVLAAYRESSTSNPYVRFNFTMNGRPNELIDAKTEQSPHWFVVRALYYAALRAIFTQINSVLPDPATHLSEANISKGSLRVYGAGWRWGGWHRDGLAITFPFSGAGTWRLKPGDPREDLDEINNQLSADEIIASPEGSALVNNGLIHMIPSPTGPRMLIALLMDRDVDAVRNLVVSGNQLRQPVFVLQAINEQ
jgi:hypothetical protein